MINANAYRLYRFGIQKIQETLPKLIRIVLELGSVFELLRDNLFQLIMDGKPLRIALLKVSGKESLLSKIEAVIRSGGNDIIIRGARVEEAEEDDEDDSTEDNREDDIDDRSAVGDHN